MSYAAVAFDIDGTLYPDANLRRLLLAFSLRHGPFLVAFARARALLHEEARAQGPGPGDLEAFRLRQAEILAALLKTSPVRAQALAQEIVYTELEGYFRGVDLYPGVVSCLETLSRAGLALAAFSDFPAQAKVEYLGLSRLLPLARTSEASGRLKPSPRGFLAFARELELPPERILYVGNSVRYDVAGAKAAGMHAALRVGRGRPASSGKPSLMRGADFVFSDWKDLAPYVLGRAEAT